VRIVTIRRLDYGETAESFTTSYLKMVSHRRASESNFTGDRLLSNGIAPHWRQSEVTDAG